MAIQPYSITEPTDNADLSQWPAYMRQTREKISNLVSPTEITGVTFEDNTENGDAVYYDVTAGIWKRSLKAEVAPERDRFHGIAVVATGANAVKFTGSVINDSWLFTVGQPVYVSATELGDLTQDDTGLLVGLAIGVDALLIDSQISYAYDQLRNEMIAARGGEDSLNARLDSIAAEAAASTAKNTTQDGRLTALEGVDTVQGAAISALEGRATSLEGRMTDAEGDIVGHTHTEASITDLDKYTESEVDALIQEAKDYAQAYADSIAINPGVSWILEDLVLNVPGTYATLAAALEYLEDKRILPTATVTILIAAGTHTVAPIVINHPDASMIVIKGDVDSAEVAYVIESYNSTTKAATLTSEASSILAGHIVRILAVDEYGLNGGYIVSAVNVVEGKSVITLTDGPAATALTGGANLGTMRWSAANTVKLNFTGGSLQIQDVTLGGLQDLMLYMAPNKQYYFQLQNSVVRSAGVLLVQNMVLDMSHAKLSADTLLHVISSSASPNYMTILSDADIVASTCAFCGKTGLASHGTNFNLITAFISKLTLNFANFSADSLYCGTFGGENASIVLGTWYTNRIGSLEFADLSVNILKIFGAGGSLEFHQCDLSIGALTITSSHADPIKLIDVDAVIDTLSMVSPCTKGFYLLRSKVTFTGVVVMTGQNCQTLGGFWGMDSELYFDAALTITGGTYNGLYLSNCEFRMNAACTIQGNGAYGIYGRWFSQGIIPTTAAITGNTSGVSSPAVGVEDNKGSLIISLV